MRAGLWEKTEIPAHTALLPLPYLFRDLDHDAGASGIAASQAVGVREKVRYSWKSYIKPRRVDTHTVT